MTTDVSASSAVKNESGIARLGDYAFVMNVRHLIDADRYTIAPGLELRRATAEEIIDIKARLRSLRPFHEGRDHSLWERRWPPTLVGKVEYLAESEWRYFVIALRGTAPITAGGGAGNRIEMTGSNDSPKQLYEAFDLAPLELEVAFTVFFGTVLFAKDLFGSDKVNFHLEDWDPGRLFHVLESASRNHSFFHDISTSDIEVIQGIYSQLQNHDHPLIDMRRLTTELGQLKGLPHSSPLRFLGYFALLESLLTHKPEPSDPYDSITRQVKKKLALLDHRWPRPLDYSPFKGATIDTIWSRMYAYRSLVAHGGTPAFTGRLEILRNHDTALILLKETVKAVVRQALVEPQLLVDLREC
jgi:hypothetical protein